MYASVMADMPSLIREVSLSAPKLLSDAASLRDENTSSKSYMHICEIITLCRFLNETCPIVAAHAFERLVGSGPDLRTKGGVFVLRIL